MRNHSYIILLILSLCCISCSKGSDEFNSRNRYNTVVTIIHGIDGLGDMGYNDLVAIGAAQAAEVRNLAVYSLTPRSMDEADSLIRSWIEHKTGEANRRLLIVGDECFKPLLGQIIEMYRDGDEESGDKGNIVPNISGWDERVLLLGDDADIEGIHSIYVSYYDACYKAGQMTAMMKAEYDEERRSKRVLMVCANPNVRSVRDGRDGFMDGYTEYAGKDDIDIVYLDNGVGGYDMQESVYRSAYEWSKDYSVVFPLCGGSANGLYSFCHENRSDSKMVAIGVDADKSIYEGVPFSVMRPMDKVVYRYIVEWYDKKTFDQ